MRDPDLSNKQKFVLSKIAEEAFTVAARHFATDDLPQKDWRHREAILAVGCQISEARNSQYNALKRHFENLAGRAGQAFATAMKEPTELQRQLRHQIGQALSTAGLHPNYAETLARGPRFKSPGGVAGMTDDQLRQLLFTLVNRGRAKALR